jgi:hypothetical protein
MGKLLMQRGKNIIFELPQESAGTGDPAKLHEPDLQIISAILLQ